MVKMVKAYTDSLTQKNGEMIYIILFLIIPEKLKTPKCHLSLVGLNRTLE